MLYGPCSGCHAGSPREVMTGCEDATTGTHDEKPREATKGSPEGKPGRETGDQGRPEREATTGGDEESASAPLPTPFVELRGK